MSDDSEFVDHEPCPKCGSDNNLARYSDGHAYCFTQGCGHYEKGEGEATHTNNRRRMSDDLIDVGSAQALGKRKLTKETCEKWGYTVAEHFGTKVQIANFRDSTGRIVGQKVRYPNKDFVFLGDIKESGLYGQHLWRDGGKMVVITEGELDALSVSQAQGNRWPVVSIPNGTNGAKKAIASEMKWLDKFETVVLMFDMDEPGREAAQECAGLFKPGRCKIAALPLKDPSDMLQAGRENEIIDSIWGAKAWRPDGIVTASDLRDRVLEDPVNGYPWFLEGLNKHTFGRRLGELYFLGAGTGVGKTDLLTEQVQFDLNRLQLPVGMFMLEQMPVETLKRVAGKAAGRTFHVPDGSWQKHELIEALDQIDRNSRLFLYDSFGATDWEIIANTIRFLAHSEGVKVFYVDHLTALAAAESDERTGLERITAEMSSLAKELQIILIVVSHLATPEGKPHEEGGRVMIRHFKGSRAIGFWAHFMFGMERNQQHEDEALRTVTILRILKDRYTGRGTGQIIFLQYDQTTGRLSELDQDPFAERKGDAFKDETTDNDEGAF